MAIEQRAVRTDDDDAVVQRASTRFTVTLVEPAGNRDRMRAGGVLQRSEIAARNHDGLLEHACMQLRKVGAPSVPGRRRQIHAG